MTVISGEKIDLTLLSSERIKLHEECDDYRFKHLIERFKNEKVLYNPLIVGRYNNKFILIDGANRYEALKKIGCKTVLCQLVNYKSAKVILKSWNHLVYGITLTDLRNFLKNNELRFEQVSASELRKKIRSNFGKIFVVDKLHGILMIKLNGKLLGILTAMSRLSKYYERKYEYERIDGDINFLRLKEMLPHKGLLFIYPQFKKNHIVEISGLSQKLPAGITRHIIPNRVLHIKYELKLLKNDGGLKQQNRDLLNVIQQKITQKKVRVYKEPIIIFDE